MSSSKIPNSFFMITMSSCLLRIEKTAALIQPQMIAGRILVRLSAPCFQRKNDAMTADGIKKSRLMILAALCSMFNTRVSHSIRRLPPPTPIPDRKPSELPISNMNGSESNINSVPRPRESAHPISGAAILSECVSPKYLRPHHPHSC